MKLYSSAFAPNPQRVVLFAQKKKISLEIINMNLAEGQQKSPDYIEKNPFGQVPLLELNDGTVIAETRSICLYLEETYPEINLLGKTPLEKAEIDMMCSRIESNLIGVIGQIFFHSNPMMASRGSQILEWADFNRKKLDKHYEIFEDLIAGRDFVATQRVSFADITLYCALTFAQRVGVAPQDNFQNLNHFLPMIEKYMLA